jgi:hypothetical protein
VKRIDRLTLKRCSEAVPHSEPGMRLGAPFRIETFGIESRDDFEFHIAEVSFCLMEDCRRASRLVKRGLPEKRQLRHHLERAGQGHRAERRGRAPLCLGRPEQAAGSGPAARPRRTRLSTRPGDSSTRSAGRLPTLRSPIPTTATASRRSPWPPRTATAERAAGPRAGRSDVLVG